jgi:hypothetical protein
MAKPKTQIKQRVDIRTLTQSFLQLASDVVNKISIDYHSGKEISKQDMELLTLFTSFTLTSRKVQIERIKAGIDTKQPQLQSTQSMNANNLRNILKLASSTEEPEAEVDTIDECK